MAKYKTARSGNYLDRTYIGVVKTVEDAKFAGRIRVWIPEFESREEDEAGWIICNYCSPFGGVTNRDKNSQSHFDLFDKTQTAYGMWMIPPDINNDVIVMFPSGDVNRAIWIGSVFKEYMNHSVPEAAYSDNSKQFFGEGKKIPVTEYNKWDRTGDSDDPLKAVRPFHQTRFEGISEQGLIADEIRGITTSSSMRETPSQVFGINTPGAKSKKTEGAREGGHSFIMDDGDEDGNDSYIGFKTKSGATIRIDDTNGLIYAINKKGTGWIQMDADGNVDIFGAESISMRTQKDFNIRADGNINMEAGHDVNIKAAQNTDAEGKFVEEGAGEGGNVYVEALNNLYTTVDDSVFLTVKKGNVDIDVQGEESGDFKTHIAGNADMSIDGNLTTSVKGNVDLEASGYIHNTAGSEFTIAGSNAALDASGNLKINGTLETGGNAKIGGDVLAVNGMFSGVVKCTSLIAGSMTIGRSSPFDDPAPAGGMVVKGKVYAADFLTPSVALSSLAGHTHGPGTFKGYSATPILGISGSSGDSGSPAPESPEPPIVTPPNAPEPPDPIEAAPSTPAEMTSKVTAVNVLLEFDGTVAMNLNNDNVAAVNSSSTVEIPDYWNRKTEDIESIVARLITYEPCPAHINKGKKS